jgi:hypothetical protein
MPKRKLDNLPDNIINTIHAKVARNNVRSSQSLAQVSKVFRKSVPKNRNNRVPYNANTPFKFPKTHGLPGDDDISKWRHVMQCFNSFLKTLKHDIQTGDITSGMSRRRYYAFVKRRALMIFDSSDINTKNVGFRFSNPNSFASVTRVRNTNNSNANIDSENYIPRGVRIRVKVQGTRTPFYLDLYVQLVLFLNSITPMVELSMIYGSCTVNFSQDSLSIDHVTHPHLKNIQIQNMNITVANSEMYASVHTMTRQHAIDLYRAIYLLKRVWSKVYRLSLKTVWVATVVLGGRATQVVEDILRPLGITVYEEGFQMIRAPSARLANSNTNANEGRF